jgi:Family of unknown function (DUF5754)
MTRRSRSGCLHPVEAFLSVSHNPQKKYDVRMGKKTVSFGARGMSDYTLHKDALRKERYLDRHKKREDWTASGIRSPGFWSRWLLWNLPSLTSSAKDLEARFCARVVTH